MRLYGEYFGNGHPDRLCDKLVDVFAIKVLGADGRKGYRLNCRIDNNKVYLYGEVRKKNEDYQIDYDKGNEVIKSFFKDVGYGLRFLNKDETVTFNPNPDELEIQYDIKCYPDAGEYNERILTNFAFGYACKSPSTQNLPIAHYLALVIGMYFTEMVKTNPLISPNFKLEVILEKQGEYYAWDSLILNIIHDERIGVIEIFRSIKDKLTDFINDLKVWNLDTFDASKIKIKNRIYGIDKSTLRFVGYSNNRLSFDYYGPQIQHPDFPLHGRAMCEIEHMLIFRNYALDIFDYKCRRGRGVDGAIEVYVSSIMRNEINYKDGRSKHGREIEYQDCYPTSCCVIQSNGQIMHYNGYENTLCPLESDCMYYRFPIHKSENLMLDMAKRKGEVYTLKDLMEEHQMKLNKY